jgi:hypothetical protein
MTEFQYLNQANTEAQDRLASSFLFAQDSTGLATDGVLAGLAVSQTTTASASVNVAAGACVIQDTVLNGVALMVNDSLKALDVLTANPMGATPRNDIVVFDSATTSVRLIVGVPNAVPTDPTVPITALALARIRNAASATTVPAAAIDQLPRQTSVVGGRAIVASAAARDLMTKYNGLRVWRTDVGREETWDGTGWLTEVYALDTVVNTNTTGEFSITTGLSTILYANIYNGNGGTVRAGNRRNITLARNSTGTTYTGGTLTGIAFAADTKVALGSDSFRVDWMAKGYA